MFSKIESFDTFFSRMNQSDTATLYFKDGGNVPCSPVEFYLEMYNRAESDWKHFSQPVRNDIGGFSTYLTLYNKFNPDSDMVRI
jgi:hypothetical protein